MNRGREALGGRENDAERPKPPRSLLAIRAYCELNRFCGTFAVRKM